MLSEFLAETPGGWRFFLKQRIFEEVEASRTETIPLAVQMHDLFGRMRERYHL
ncbi:hypothetical protein AB4Z52_29760 [Rhizobium sp. 2YAF20]|uniref:hypothetical protein n=1 Tax=Rhizobium sp. 2YAF20 TaxID=3233027 RepID=UPI003F95FACE